MFEAVPKSGEFRYCVDDLIIDVDRQRVLRGNSEISLSPLSFELLLALVLAAPEVVSLDALMKRVWPGVVVNAETVSQRVKLVRDALGDHADAPRYIAGVRGRGYRIVAPVRRMATPGSPVESPSGPPAPGSATSLVAPARYLRLLIATVALAIFAVTVLVYLGRKERIEEVSPDKVSVSVPGARPTEPLLLVLPLENLGREEDEYFADGMTDEISARLAKIGSLGVIGRASAMHYKGTTKTIREIADELGVDYILDGSVRWAHEDEGTSRVRITPQLVRAADARQLWAEVYEEPLTGIFRVQAAIAERVTEALDLTLVEPERRAIRAEPTDNPEAYAYYLRGEDYRWRSHGDADQEIHLRMYERAVELDPEFALAHAAISHSHIRMYWFRHDHTPERLARAKAAVDRALELDPDLPPVRWTLGMYYYWGYLDYDRALVEYELARDAAPHYSQARNGIGLVSRRQGRWQKAIENFKIAARLDPLNPTHTLNLGETYLVVQDYENAERYLIKAFDLAPDSAQAAYGLAWVYLARDGHTRRARAVLEEAPPVMRGSAEKLLLLGLLRLDLLDRDFQGMLDRIATISWPAYDGEEDFQPMALFRAYAYEGLGQSDLTRMNFESSVTLLETALREQPFEPRLHSSLYGSLGIAYAGLDRKEEALQAGRRAVELLPVERDALSGRVRMEELARIYSMTGEHDAAVEVLEFLLSPGSSAATPFSIVFLRLDPAWDPLREHPRFQALVAQREP